MKTTIEIPDDIFRAAKAAAAREGRPLKQFVADALKEKLRYQDVLDRKPWLKHFGALSHLPAEEHELINRRIEEFCERIDEEKW